MFRNRKAANRRFERRQVLDVKLRTREVRQARIKLAATALTIALGTIACLFVLWRGGDWALGTFVFTNDAFAIRHLDLQTDGAIPVEQLRKWSGVSRGDNLLALDLTRVKRDLELVPLVESVTVERVLPSTLRVRVTEREPVAQVKLPQLTPRGLEFSRYFLDPSGHVVSVNDLASVVPALVLADELPVLTGVNGALLVPGRAVNSPSILAALRLITSFDDSPMAGLVDIESIEVSNPTLLGAATGQGNHITFATDRIEEQLRRWRAVHDFGRQHNRAILSLDLSPTNNSPALWLEASAVPAVPPKVKPPSRNRKKHV